MMKTLRDIVLTILIAILMFVGLRYTIEGYTVRYVCMMPSICDGDWIIVNKATYFFSDPQRGDVSVFWPPEDKVNSDFPFIKRVIGLPGETVEIINGDVLINGIVITEKYIKEAPDYTMQKKFIPAGEYFVLGDNRNNANDSHSWGTVPRDNFVGKPILTYWPLDKWAKTKHYSYPELDTNN